MGILSTLGIATYRQVLDNARQKVCETNLKTLEAAVEMYALENDALPASLGDLKPSHVKKAYAKVMREEGWLTKFAYFFVKLNTPKEVYAQFLTYDRLGKYGPAAQVFHCPADTNGGVSYGINAQLAGKRWGDISEDTLIVADCDSHTFGRLAYRHIKNLGAKRVALGIKKNKRKVVQEEGRGRYERRRVPLGKGEPAAPVENFGKKGKPYPVGEGKGGTGKGTPGRGKDFGEGADFEGGVAEPQEEEEGGIAGGIMSGCE